jgi:hypothetical protein
MSKKISKKKYWISIISMMLSPLIFLILPIWDLSEPPPTPFPEYSAPEPIPDEENARTYFLKAYTLAGEPSHPDILKRDSENLDPKEEYRELFENSDLVLQQIETGLSCKTYQHVFYLGPSDFQYNSIPGWDSGAKATYIPAVLSRLATSEEESEHYLSLHIQMLDMIRENPNSIYDWYINANSFLENIRFHQYRFFSVPELKGWENAVSMPESYIMFWPNIYGKVLLYAYDEASIIQPLELKRHLELNATLLFQALLAYERDQGHLPDTLEDLVPGYLGEIPKDPHSQQLFLYRPHDRLFYSVGRNKTDDGGAVNQEYSRDILFILPPKLIPAPESPAP